MVIFSLIGLRGSRSQMFCKIDVLKNFAILTEKQLCWSLFLITTLLKKYCEKCKIFKNSFLTPMVVASYLTRDVLGTLSSIYEGDICKSFLISPIYQISHMKKTDQDFLIKAVFFCNSLVNKFYVSPFFHSVLFSVKLILVISILMTGFDDYTIF